MDGWLRFYGILSMQIVAISCPGNSLKFTSKTNGLYKRNYWFNMNSMFVGVYILQRASLLQLCSQAPMMNVKQLTE